MSYPLKTIDSGITFKRTYPTLVPEIEEREASRTNGYTWASWQTLPHDERVYGVAYARARRLIEMNQNDAQDREMQRQSKRKGKR